MVSRLNSAQKHRLLKEMNTERKSKLDEYQAEKQT